MTAPTPHPAHGYAGDLTPADAYDLLSADETAVLVDVRTEGEWRAIGVPDTAAIGRAPVFVQWLTATGSTNPSFVDELRDAGADGNRPLVFLCRSGVRSVAAARAATEAGLGPAYNVLRGFEGEADSLGRRETNGWRVEGLPSGEWAGR